MVRVEDVMAAMEQLAPAALAMPGDRIGLQIGRRDKPVRKVGLALDPSPPVIHHAIRAGVDLLITHHALFYHPLGQIDTGTSRGQALAAALAHDLAVFVAHTNLDIADGGVNDVLAELLGLQACEVLEPIHEEHLYKLVVYVPTSHHETVLAAVCAAGAGHIGRYSHCTFNVAGTGTFLPEEGARPYIGEAGRLERVEEVRLETIVPAGRLAAVTEAMLSAHPYEEVAYDVYPLRLPGRTYGLGRVGALSRPMSLSAFAEHVRQVLGLPHIRYAGDPDRSVRRVAVIGGSGSKWAATALRKGADVLVTADCDHHALADAWHDGLAMVDATHAALERPVLRSVAAALHRKLGGAVEVDVLAVPEDPVRWL
ncbi:GTP cyclohydrolase 1 type 2 [Alicyclobacillus cellulosilyticus]|uniref:GTP cyclohydrolase 1 type 2 homolog n=1 Tax=Alicyclobacillus cellulosilyticus TaxID=1003997 RepID=A0A917NLA4_9BACL|nr:Nif3-like dinuclear metal center hexameric protein [Alicyclobacillus cellulosilyticus]GGJ09190.1 GTP cyclohydrolase 1 type 2 [Alicyclobacillus cellulosilyticus]